MIQEMPEVLVCTGPGTPLGNVMRRYWVPALLACEIPEPDCPPVRVRILNEKMLAFRDSLGRAGLIDEFCAHRATTLFLGRNEEGGMRCSYHGWKYDITGQCVELPGAPQIAPKIRIKAYPCVERGGIVWAYMGPPDKRPDPPALEWCVVPDSHRFVSKRLQECNYLQALEGGIDTGHVSWVHRWEMDIDPMHDRGKAIQYIKGDGAVKFEIEEAPSGLTILGRRNGESDSYYWRITQWIFPWFTLIPPFGNHAVGAHIWVPIDDENCWAWNINFLPDRPLPEDERQAMEEGKGIHVKYIPGTFRPLANKENDYLIDRKAQQERRSFSGVEGFSMQDASLQEGMGPIQDRSREHLVATDKAIVMTRRMLFEATRAMAEGREPPALAGATQRVRSASVLLDRSADAVAWARDHLADGLNEPLFTL